MLDLLSGSPKFKSRPDHQLDLFLVVGPSSNPHLLIANWFASYQLGFLNIIIMFYLNNCFIIPEKPDNGSR